MALKLTCPRCRAQWEVSIADSYQASAIACPNGCDRVPAKDHRQAQAAELALQLYAIGAKGKRTT